MRSPKAIALASLLFTYLFFFEYLPPVRWVHLSGDLEAVHYSLADFTFQSLRQLHFPGWDPTIYCGMSLVSNVNAALYYPPSWLMFVFNSARERLSYQSMQDLLIAHVWIGFLLCYLWLRGKRLAELPCVLGAGVFAFSGYVCSQLQHLGAVAGYSWIPLALWGVDQAVERRSWRPFWKVAVASALGLLSGYPAWILFAVGVVLYSLAGAWRWKAFAGTAASLCFSLLLAAIQILPAWEDSGMRSAGLFAGIPGWNLGTILSYTLPNPKQDYLYLGVPALFGLPFLFHRRPWRDLAPSVLLGASPAIASVTLAFAALAAYALDNFLGRKGSRTPAWLMPTSISLMAVWAGYELLRWKHQSVPMGWGSSPFLLLSLVLFAAGVYALRAADGPKRMWMAAALILFVGADYKAFGTSKRFNAAPGKVERYTTVTFAGMGNDVYQELRANAGYRIMVDPETGPPPNDFRHLGLMTPQGYDPLLAAPFRKVLERYDADPANDDAMRLFGVKYVITTERGKLDPKLRDNARFRLMGSEPAAYRVYEYLDAQPPYSWEGSREGMEMEPMAWKPESRMFKIRSASGGKLALHEQMFPGSTVWLDGEIVTDEPWMEAFQAVSVPAGEHTVEFRYHSRLIGLGRAISLLALVGLVYWVRSNSRSRSDTAYRAASG